VIEFTKPTNLNGTELRKELNDAGVTISDNIFSVMVDSYGNLKLDILDADKTKATKIVAAHNGTTVAPEPTITDKLASVGLSVSDLKEALGL
jgi:hypothetical protein